MDRMLYLAMSAAKNTLQAQAVVSHNLANASTTGFRADLLQFRSMPVFGAGKASRVYALPERPGTDFSPGRIDHSGNELDVAIDGEGLIAIQMPDGSEAYTRAGDLHMTSTGLLENGAGYPVLGNAGPISIPQAEKIEIAVDGTVSVRPSGQDEKTLVTVDRIKLVNPALELIYKGLDGQFRLKDSSLAAADANVRIIPGALESSNVNMVSALVDMIALARQFEMNIRTMHSVEENDQSATQILRFPQ
ncbi:MAG: flagellar basal-body rod protein FlgF [Gammaproteobacteria bacterium]